MSHPDPSRTQAWSPPTDADVVVVVEQRDQLERLEDLLQSLPRLLDAGPRSLVVDLSSTTHLSSGAVAALLWMRRACLPRGVPVQVRQPAVRASAPLRGLGTALALEGPQR